MEKVSEKCIPNHQLLLTIPTESSHHFVCLRNEGNGETAVGCSGTVSERVNREQACRRVAGTLAK